MSLHIAGTFYVPEGERRTVTLPLLREGNEQGRVLLFENRGEVYVPAYVEEADTDDLLLLNQYNAEPLITKVDVLSDVRDDFDPSEGTWVLTRSDSGRLNVEYEPPMGTDASEAM